MSEEFPSSGPVKPADCVCHASSLASALQVLSGKAATQALRERGRALVESEHTVKVILDQIEAIYRRRLCTG